MFIKKLLIALVGAWLLLFTFIFTPSLQVLAADEPELAEDGSSSSTGDTSTETDDDGTEATVWDDASDDDDSDDDDSDDDDSDDDDSDDDDSDDDDSDDDDSDDDDSDDDDDSSDEEFENTNPEVRKCFNSETMRYNTVCINNYMQKELAKVKNKKKALNNFRKEMLKDLNAIKFNAKKNAIKKKIGQRRLSPNMLKGLWSKIGNIPSKKLEIILKRIDNADESIENSNIQEDKKEMLLDVLAELEELIIEELNERGESEDDFDEEDLLNDIFSDDSDYDDDSNDDNDSDDNDSDDDDSDDDDSTVE